ncbi:hypothetical protein F1880_000590 [Penicillium rolfsii]|nr:hypothetical protein F1880_000590 [Penicillium rolfsii]
MGQLKEGPMACTRANNINFTNELIQRKNECAKRLTEHYLQTPDVIWQSQDGEGPAPFSEGDKANFKLVDTITYDNGNPTGKIVWPPKYTRLSDELVYLATKFLKAGDRAAKYPYDFNDRGDIREQRVPSGVSPIVWAHGLPFFPVFKGYYILCGREHASWVGWLLNKKQHRTMVAYPMWTIGPVMAPGSAVNLSRTVTRQMHLHVPKSAKDVDKRWEKVDTARDVVSRAHYLLSVVPKTPSKGFILAPIYQVEGYHVRCGPNTITGGKGLEIGRRTLSNHGVTDFDYDASLRRPYTNEENPAAIHSDESDKTSEEGDSDSINPMSGMDEDEDDDRGDKLFHLPSEESVETGDSVEEPPKKKLKTQPRVFDNTTKPFTNSKKDINFNKARAVNLLATTTASVKHRETNESVGAQLAVDRLSEVVTTTNFKHSAKCEKSLTGVPADTPYKDTGIEGTAAVSNTDVITSTGNVKTAPSNETHNFSIMAEPGTMVSTKIPSLSTTKPIDEHTIHRTDPIR